MERPTINEINKVTFNYQPDLDITLVTIYKSDNNFDVLNLSDTEVIDIYHEVNRVYAKIKKNKRSKVYSNIEKDNNRKRNQSDMIIISKKLYNQFKYLQIEISKLKEEKSLLIRELKDYQRNKK